MTLKPEHLAEELDQTPKLYNRALAESSREYREKVREELAQIIVRLFRKNKVRMDDASDALDRARRYYLVMYVNRDKSKGE